MNESELTKILASQISQYLGEKEVSRFESQAREKAVSSLLLNPAYSRDFSLSAIFPFLRQDSQDQELFRFDNDERLGKSLLHFGGAFYLLDPSSAAISYYLKDLVGENPLVLDLCAAPGGKSICFSFRRPDSLILANDISYTRAEEISHNTDRLGLTNVLTLSLDPQKLSLPPLFDLVILDAPCSGSGMFRKDRKMAEDWSEDKESRLLPLQKDLLNKADTFLKKGGILAYSTCSLSVKEDEEQITLFLKNHKEYEEIRIAASKNIMEGKKGYHMVPGLSDGEGIYFCFLRKKEGQVVLPQEMKYKDKSPVFGLKAFSYRKNTFLLQRMYKDFVSLPFLTPGIKVNDDSPHPKCPYDHAYSKVADVVPLLPLSEEEAISYAKGEEIRVSSSAKDSLVILTYEGIRLGFGKKVGGRIKNYLPKGLRMNLLPAKEIVPPTLQEVK
ncbi:MAG: hypothetical protein WCS91_05790 [Bacilli bacterium]